MEEKLLYLSKPWRDELETRLKVALTPEKMKNLTSSLNNHYHNCPDGKDRFYFISFKAGEIDELIIDEGNGPAAEFSIIADYEVFASISRGEINAQKALMTGQVKLKGNMVKALKLASLMDRINKITAEIPTEF